MDALAGLERTSRRVTMAAKKAKAPKEAQPAGVPAVKTDTDWQADDDARTMQRFGEIIGDEKRHQAAKAKLAKLKASISSVEDLKAAYQEKYGHKAMMKAHEKAEGEA
jgi:hypothetical protein